MDDSFLTLAKNDNGDELSYFKQMLEVAQAKAYNTGYAERRAQEIANGDTEEYSMEGKKHFTNFRQSYNYLFSNIDEVTLVMEEITEKEKDYRQLVDVTQSLIERSQEMSVRVDEQSNQMEAMVMEQAKLEDQSQ